MTKIIQGAVISTIVSVGGQAPAQEKSTAHLAPVQEYAAQSEVHVARCRCNAQLIFPSPKKVRHELVTLPYYNLFDWLEFMRFCPMRRSCCVLGK
ncbi:MAG: hypothetical protein WKF84_27875 [Pyrinomonadaceae bacterium]